MTIQTGVVGTKIEITVKDQNGNIVDLTNFISGKIHLKTPLLNVKEFTATRSNPPGTDGLIQYTTTSTADLDEDGLWEVQPEVDINTWSGRGTKDTFEVEANL